MEDDALESHLEIGNGLTSVDAYEVEDIARALRAIAWTDKARVMVRALASAPDRALSRLAMARLVGSDSVNSTNTVLGNFCKALALEIDSDLLDEWKPSGTGRRNDWVMFACYGVTNEDPVEGDTDSWRFGMREGLAKALEQIGFAPFVASELDELSDDDDEDDYPSSLEEIDSASTDGEFDELSETERNAVVLARIGQGRFRDALLERWDGRCAVTGVSVEAALVASHIKPWSFCTNAERLDPDNGLLLVGTLDRLFDCGLISFDADGMLLVSPRVPVEQRAKLGISGVHRVSPVPVTTAAFLAFHRESCFWDSLDDEADDDEIGQ
jgi:hypothetical protein